MRRTMQGGMPQPPQLTKFSFLRAPGRAHVTALFNSSTCRDSLVYGSKSAARVRLTHALPVRAEQIRGLEHEQNPVVLIAGGLTGICAGARWATAPKSGISGERQCKSRKRKSPGAASRCALPK